MKVPDSQQAGVFDDLGRRLFEAATAAGRERQGFLDWLRTQLGARIEALAGYTTLLRFEEVGVPELLATLRSNRSRLHRDPDARDFVEALDRERGASIERLSEVRATLQTAAREADERVYDLYSLTAAHRAVIEADEVSDEAR